MLVEKEYYFGLSLICLIIFVVGCSNIQSIGEKQTTETLEQETILNLITSGKWEEAKLNLAKPEFKSIENYKEIFAYVDARNDYENEKASGKIEYEPIGMKMNSIDLDTYNGKLKDEITVFKKNSIMRKKSIMKHFMLRGVRKEKRNKRNWTSIVNNRWNVQKRNLMMISQMH